MADSETSSKTPGKSKKKLKPWQMAVYGLGGLGALYIGYRLYENYQTNAATNAANTAATTAATPTSDGSATPADIATGGPTAGSETGDPLQVIDPNSPTGATYGQELDDLEAASGTSGTNAAQIADLESQVGSSGITTAEIATIEAQISALATSASVPPDPTGVAPESRAALIAEVQKATGLSAAEAGQQVALYLEGKPLTNVGAVNSIGNQVKAGLAPVTNGATTLPTPVLAKSATAGAPSSALATSEANLKSAEAAEAKDPTAANKDAVAAHESQVKAGR